MYSEIIGIYLSTQLNFYGNLFLKVGWHAFFSSCFPSLKLNYWLINKNKRRSQEIGENSKLAYHIKSKLDT